MAKQEKVTRGNPQGPMGGMFAGGAKAKNFKGSLKSLFKYISPFKIIIFVSMILAAAAAVLTIFGPKISNGITTEINRATNLKIPIVMETIVNIAIILIVIYICSAVFNFIQGFLMAGISAKVSKKLRSEIVQKINKMPLKYFDGNTYGDVLSRVTNDVDTISNTIGDNISGLISGISMLIGIPIMMFTLDWVATLTYLACIPILVILMAIVIKFSQKHFRRQASSVGAINGHIEEIYSAHNIVKVFNGEKDAQVKFDEINGQIYTSTYKSQFLSGLIMPIINFIGNFGYAAVCIVFGLRIIANGTIPYLISMLSSLPFFLIYLRQFNNPIQQIGSAVSTLQSTAAASERVFEFLKEVEQPDESHKTLTIPKVEGKVEFKNVAFGYVPEKEIIHDFSCTAKPGQKIAIVGPTGAGKTTLVNLLMRFYEINSGDILIDGVSIKDMNRRYVRNLFGMVLQDTWLFEGTVKENIKFGKPDATDEEVIAACEAANVDHLIRSQPGGYDMKLDEDSGLSAGEKQLFTIARAMVQNAPMLILDEATSSVDTRTEELIQKAMDKLMKGRTSFVIAHRLSTIKNADLILVMRDGDIVESGTHKQLIEKEGFYADLYNSQFSHKYSEEGIA